MAVAIAQASNPAGVSAIANASTYSGVGTGTASNDRIVAVLIGKEVATTVVSTVTIDGAAMTLANGTTFASMGAWIYYLSWPTGTTATIVVNWNGAILDTENHIAVYAITDAAAPPKSTGVNTSTDMDVTAPLTTGSITIATNGGFIAVAAGAADAAAGNKTWANATENLDADAGGFQFTTAFRTTALAATAVTCTGGTNGEDGVLAYAIFEQATIPSLVMPPPTPPTPPRP